MSRKKERELSDYEYLLAAGILYEAGLPAEDITSAMLDVRDALDADYPGCTCSDGGYLDYLNY